MLSMHFPLVADERSKPFAWSWDRDAESFDLPGMTPVICSVCAGMAAMGKDGLADCRPGRAPQENQVCVKRIIANRSQSRRWR